MPLRQPLFVLDRTTTAVAAGKLAARLSQRLRGGGGTALPGVIAERIDPTVIRQLTHGLRGGAILVTATNGKTTASRMLAAILEQAGRRVVANTQGSNLTRGIASALVARTSLDGRLPRDPKLTGLFEVDEAHIPAVAAMVQPQVILIGNLFRDQLDRYGEVDLVSDRWREAAAALPPEQWLVLNADDPGVAAVGAATSGRVLYFGIEDMTITAGTVEHAADARWCPRCGAPFEYRAAYYGHLGHYRCPGGDWARPTPAIAAHRVRLRGLEGAEADLVTPIGSVSLRVPLPGLFNVYNALAAAAAAIAFGIPLDTIAAGIASVHAAFGRFEQVDLHGRRLVLLLAKNPTGLNQALGLVLSAPGAQHALFALNDLEADGTDVSWIWDGDFERLAGRLASVGATGIRAADMALRLKYAGLADEAPLPVEPDIGRAVTAAVDRLEPGATLFVIATYTAMLELRRFLVQQGVIRHYLESD